MEKSTVPEIIQPGWYWHHHSQRPAYVFHTEAGWQAQFVGGDAEQEGAINHDGQLTGLRIDLPLELYLQFVPLSRRASVEVDRRRNPMYPLVLPCAQCGNLAPSSFKPVGDGTWVAQPYCDVHLAEKR